MKNVGDEQAERQYETFEHQADVGVRGFGESQEEAFARAAEAMYSVMVERERVLPAEKRTLRVEAPERDLLLVEWLNGLLALSDIERMVFSRFSVKIRGKVLRGEAWGEPLDRDRHHPKVEVKGATYHLMRVGKEGARFVAQCVVDV